MSGHGDYPVNAPPSMPQRAPLRPLDEALAELLAHARPLAGADDLDLVFDDMVVVISALTSADFYKSMTSHADHRVWQDVYRPRISTPLGDTEVYIKLTVVDGVLIVSFKEL